MRVRWRLRSLSGLAAAVAVTAGVLAGLPAGASPAPAAPPPTPFAVGLSPGSGLLYVPPPAVRGSLAAMASTGDRWVRLDVPWPMVESRPGRWDWGPEDTAVTAARTAGLTVDVILDYAPDWAIRGHAPDPVAYGAFVTRAVERYAPLGVHTYEIWNEENLSSAWPAPIDPVAYGRTLAAAYTAVHRHDPQGLVLLGGLGRAPQVDSPLAEGAGSFLRQLLSSGFGRDFDAVAVHPYSYPEPPGLGGPDDLFATVPHLHDLMAHYGQGAKQIWITEYGTPAAGPIGDLQQAAYLRSAVDTARRWSWAGPLFVFSWQDGGGQSFGLIDAAGQPKPALAVFRTAPH